MKPVIKTSQTPLTTSEGEYIKIPVKDSRTAMRACLHMILKHTADTFITITDIIAEKYKLDTNEVIETVRAHPKFNQIYEDPVLLDLGYIGEAPPVVATQEEAIKTPENPHRRGTPPNAPQRKWSEEAKKAAAEKRAAKKAAAAASGGTSVGSLEGEFAKKLNFEEEAAEEEAPRPVKVKSFTIKPKAKKAEVVASE